MNREMFAYSKIKVKIKLQISPYSDIAKATALGVLLDVHDTDFIFVLVNNVNCLKSWMFLNAILCLVTG